MNQLLAGALPAPLQATLDVFLSCRIPLASLSFRFFAAKASKFVSSAFVISKALRLELLVPSGTSILAAVFTDVFRREAEGKARRADEVASMLLRIAPDIVVVLASRLRFSTGAANRHLITTLA